MHSSRMRTVRSSSRLRGGGAVLPQCMLGYTPPLDLNTPLCEQTDTCEVKT